MTRQMRRKDRQINDIKECEDILRKSNIGVLGTVDKDNKPYVVPLNYFYLDGSIYFHCAYEGHKIDNIKHNPNVSFTVVGNSQLELENFTTKYESVIVFGQASFIEELDKKVEILNNMMISLGREVNVLDYYDIDFIKNETCIVKISIENLTGKRH